jgi:hypothetical protein
MLHQSVLEALRSGFWPLYVASMCLAVVAAYRRQAWCIARVVAAMLLASITQTLWEGAGFLQPWQHIAIDVPVFVMVTMPPRHYWQAAIAGLVFAQIVLHCVWWLAIDHTEMARVHWFGCIVLDYAKCVVLALWSGGWRVRAVFDTIAGGAARLVLGAAARERAR